MYVKTKGLFDFIVFSNLFIALCAVLMTQGTIVEFNLQQLPHNFLAFIFFSTLSSYSIHWYLTNAEVEITASRTQWLKQHKKLHALFFILSVAGTFIFALSLLRYWIYIIPAVLLTLMYTAPKFPLPIFQKLQKYILGKTILLAAMWTYVTAVLPLFILQVDFKLLHYLFVLNRFVLLFAICILFDIRDRQYDKQTGIKSLVTILPLEKIKIIFTIQILINLITSFVLYTYSQEITTFIFLSAPAIITYFLYPIAVKSKNDYLFYFILDGLMALTSVLYFMKAMAALYMA